MPGLVALAPARKQRGTADRRRVARDGLSANTKMTAAKISIQDPQLILRKRLRTEMEALHGLLSKAQLLSGKKTVATKSRAPPRCGKDAPFLAAEDHSEAEKATCAKRKKTMPVAKVAEPKMPAEEISKLTDGEIEECGGASPVAAEKSADAADSQSGGSSWALPIAPDQATYRGLIAKAFQKQRRMQNPERQRAYEQLEEMEIEAARLNDWIDPMHLTQLGITLVEFAVTGERRVPGRGCPVQRLLGLFLKPE